jgi:hypothetical protein
VSVFDLCTSKASIFVLKRKFFFKPGAAAAAPGGIPSAAVCSKASNFVLVRQFFFLPGAAAAAPGELPSAPASPSAAASAPA